MGYRLKDEKLQGILDKISNGDFSRAMRELQEERPLTYKTAIEFGKWISGTKQFRVYVKKDELIFVHEYNPNKWNVFPDVLPPENEWMRCEDEEEVHVAKWVPDAESMNHIWVDNYGQEVNVGRFRPWVE